MTALRVWHIPQVPGKAFYVAVDTPENGKKLLDALAKYDLFQFDNQIKPDYCNASGLLVYEDGEWCEWCDDETGESIDDWMQLVPAVPAAPAAPPTQEMLRAATAYSARCRASNEIPSGKGYYEAMTAAKPEEPTSSEYAQGYDAGFNDGYAPKEPPVQPGNLTAIDSLAKVYCSSYSSPHHIIFSVEGLRKMIKAAQPLPPTEPDDLTIAYMSGFADGKKVAQPVGQLCEDEFGRGQVMWFSKPADGSMLHASPPITQPVQLAPSVIEERTQQNRAARDAIDGLLDQAGFAADSSVRNLLGCMNFDPVAQPVQLAEGAAT